MTDVEAATQTFQNEVASAVGRALGDFYTVTKVFPKAIEVRLGELIHMSGVERPNILVEVKL